MKCGVAVSDLGPSQLNYQFITNTNEMVGSRFDFDAIAFYENISKPCLAMNFASMSLTEAWGFSGVMIATTLSTAQKISHFPSCSGKIFYVWDIEWVRIRNKQFSELAQVYRNPELTLVARCEDHAQLLKQIWGRDAAIIRDFDLEKLHETLAVH